MKLTLMAGVAAFLVTAGAQAAENVTGLAVCVQNRVLVGGYVMLRGQMVATALFAEAGLRIEWLSPRQCDQAGDTALRVAFDERVPSHFSPDTMAYALPYGAQGTAIHVFYSRILQNHRDIAAELLGHVIAHEIGHVLEGVARHSPNGLMKARWGQQEYASMRRPRLSFAAEDVELMHLSLRRLPFTLAAVYEKE